LAPKKARIQKGDSLMFKWLLQTEDSWALTIVRLTLGIVYFPHGAQKMLGWFGGRGFGPTVHGFEQLYHIPLAFAALAVFAEFFGSIGLILGCLTRIAAFGIAVDMMVAIHDVTWPNGFFMNWGGKQHGEGIEFQLLVIGMGIGLMIAGAGAFSVDRWLARQTGVTVATPART
jgi:putative oxidoreductase